MLYEIIAVLNFLFKYQEQAIANVLIQTPVQLNEYSISDDDSITVEKTIE